MIATITRKSRPLEIPKNLPIGLLNSGAKANKIINSQIIPHNMYDAGDFFEYTLWYK